MIYIILFFLGCCIGSFVNVIFSRKDWYKGRSRCDECGYMLKWYDLIPIVSFLMLRGKCRKCKTKIDSSHLVSELMMGATFLVSSLCFDMYGTGYGVLLSVGLFSLAVAAIEDYKEQMVYNIILTGGIICSVIAKCVVYFCLENYIEVIHILGITFILKLVSVFVSMCFEDKIGAGDFDALIIIYIICGISGLIYSVTIASIIGCLVYYPSILMKKRNKKEPFPFIPLLLLGTMCFLMIT